MSSEGLIATGNMEFAVSDRGVKMFQKEKVFYFLNIQIIRFLTLF